MTAIDWLVEQMFGEHTKAWQKQIDEAKQMEKKQTMQFAEDFIDWSTDIDPSIYDSFKEAITDYYNKTYTP